MPYLYQCDKNTITIITILVYEYIVFAYNEILSEYIVVVNFKSH